MPREATQFKPGHAKPENAGIKKGTKHRSTQMVANLFDFFEDEKVRGDLDKAWIGLNDKEKWEVFLKTLKFMVPTISSVSIEDTKTVSSVRELISKIALRRKEDQ